MAGSRPRQQHPSPSHPAVAMIAPMVPEVSLFFGGARPQLQERPQRDNSMQQNYPQLGQGFYRPTNPYSNQDIINSSVGSPLPAPPQPSNRQPQSALRRSSEFSRNFDSLSLSGSFHSTGNGNIQSQNYYGTYDESNNNRGKVQFVDFVQPVSSTSPFAYRNSETSYSENSGRQVENRSDYDYDRGARESRLKSDESPVPPEILKVLNWQNDQLKMLQEQVTALLQASPQQNSHAKASPQQNSQAYNSSQNNQPNLQNYPVLQNKQSPDEAIQVNKGQENWSQPQSSKDINKGSYKSNSVTSNTESADQQYSVASSSQRSVATNTSMLWPEIQQGLQKLTDALNEEGEGEDETYPNATEIRKSKINVNNSDNESAQSALNIDLPDYPASDCSPDLKKQASKNNPVQNGNNGESPKQAGNGSPVQAGNSSTSWDSPVQVGNSAASWESPVLGESVSMYEAEQIQEVYTDILSKVNRLLAEPEPTRDEPEQQVSRDREIFTEEYSATKENTNQNGESSMAVATCNRLRQLGVSFISPEDLTPTRQRQQSSQALNEVSALFLPRATLPSESVWHPDHSPDTSLEISSLALKYLDEAQLSKLAVVHSSGKSKTKTQQSTNMSQNNSDVNMSLATQEFLNRYGLSSNNSGSTGGTDTSPLLRSGRRPLTSIQNNQLGNVGSNKQILELRREVLKGKYASREVNNGTGANYYATGENYCVQNYEMRYDTDTRHNQEGFNHQQVNHGTSNQQQQVRFSNLNRIQPQPQQQPQQQQQPQEPEVKNRILDITAIKSQPKFL